MSSTELNHSHGSPGRTLAAWLGLCVATVTTWRLGEQAGGAALTALLLGIALVKGRLVAYEFMALRHAPLLWRALLTGWLCVVCLLIGLAYWKGLTP